MIAYICKTAHEGTGFLPKRRNEDSLKHSLVVALQNSGIDVRTALDADKISCTDEEQLIWATEQGRLLYSFNVADFCRLHSTFLAQGRGHAGILLARQQRYSVGEQLRGLLKLIATKSAGGNDKSGGVSECVCRD